MNMTRRAALRGSAAVATFAATGATLANVVLGDSSRLDKPLLELEQLWLRQRDYANTCSDEIDEDELNAACDRAGETSRQIIETPAQSYAGLLVKLRMYARERGHAAPPDDWAMWLEPPDEYAISALADLERLAREA